MASASKSKTFVSCVQ